MTMHLPVGDPYECQVNGTFAEIERQLFLHILSDETVRSIQEKAHLRSPRADDQLFDDPLL